MADKLAKPLVSTDQLAARLGSPLLRLVDATWFLPGIPRDPVAEYRAAHLPGAVFFDVDEIADHGTSLPHMVPDPVSFSKAVGRLGIGDGDAVVVYDNNGFIASARVWWMFRLYGAIQVEVLDGGLAKWRAEGRPVEDRPVSPVARSFRARRDDRLLRTLEQIRDRKVAADEQLVDARSAGRFRGVEPEPRPGLRSGHIPGSLNLPYPTLIEADGTLKPPSALRPLVAAAGIDLARPIATTCGSGISAAVLSLGFYTLGATTVPVYDGSWAEWGGRSDVSVEH